MSAELKSNLISMSIRGRDSATLTIFSRSSLDSERVGLLRKVLTNLSVSAFLAWSAGDTERLRVNGALGFKASIICCDDGLLCAIATPAGRTSAAARADEAMVES